MFSGNAGSYLGSLSGGGMFNDSSSAAVSDCTFSANTGDYGGGMCNYYSSPIVTNCTFSANTAGSGGGMYNSFSNPMVTNCILWGDGPNEIVNGSSAPTIRFSDVGGGWPGVGNINADPQFVNATGRDYRLATGSPCINAGDPAFVPQPAETDLDGHARVLCGRVDMGAYEFGFGDYDCDQEVNLTDFVGWGTCMLGPDNGPYGDGCGAFDGNLDLDVDLRDFAIFQNSMIGP